MTHCTLTIYTCFSFQNPPPNVASMGSLCNHSLYQTYWKWNQAESSGGRFGVVLWRMQKEAWKSVKWPIKLQQSKPCETSLCTRNSCWVSLYNFTGRESIMYVCILHCKRGKDPARIICQIKAVLMHALLPVTLKPVSQEWPVGLRFVSRLTSSCQGNYNIPQFLPYHAFLST